MIKKTLLFLLFLLIISSCSQKEAPLLKPKNLISKQKMIKVLEEIHLADAEISERCYRNQDSAQKAFDKMENKIFKKYKVNKKTYKSSYIYYTQNLPELAEIYTKIEVDINKKLEKEQKKNPTKANDKNKSKQQNINQVKDIQGSKIGIKNNNTDIKNNKIENSNKPNKRIPRGKPNLKKTGKFKPQFKRRKKEE